eukprot:snap_masked-scaffold_10-processed-gene-8.25-mRNA-1 protein AED:1.00 eAED:1.00 QI:0/-1/0/0/-1/1/1/0/103
MKEHLKCLWSNFLAVLEEIVKFHTENKSKRKAKMYYGTGAGMTEMNPRYEGQLPEVPYTRHVFFKAKEEQKIRSKKKVSHCNWTDYVHNYNHSYSGDGFFYRK